MWSKGQQDPRAPFSPNCSGTSQQASAPRLARSSEAQGITEAVCYAAYYKVLPVELGATSLR